MTAATPYPELQLWIEALMSKAPDYFKNNEYVRDYYQKALRNQDMMNGMINPNENTNQ